MILFSEKGEYRFEMNTAQCKSEFHSIFPSSQRWKTKLKDLLLHLSVAQVAQAAGCQRLHCIFSWRSQRSNHHANNSFLRFFFFSCTCSCKTITSNYRDIHLAFVSPKKTLVCICPWWHSSAHTSLCLFPLGHLLLLPRVGALWQSESGIRYSETSKQ